MFAVLRLCRPMIACDVTLLPEPDSPTMASGLAALDGEGDAVDGADEAVLGRELDLEVADVEVARRRCPPASVRHTSLTRGSMTA